MWWFNPAQQLNHHSAVCSHLASPHNSEGWEGELGAKSKKKLIDGDKKKLLCGEKKKKKEQEETNKQNKNKQQKTTTTKTTGSANVRTQYILKAGQSHQSEQ